MSDSAQKKPLKVWVTPRVTGVAEMNEARNNSKPNLMTEDGFGNGPSS